VLGAPKVTFTLPYPPSLNRIYRSKVNGGVRKTASAKKWAVDAGWAYKASGGIRLTGPVTIMVNLFQPADGQKRDVDNALKILLDAMNGVAWIDDSQVVAIGAVKFPPRDRLGSAEVKIWQL